MMTFDGIVEFVAVAETQGFTAAARRLGVSTSYVSRKISSLEARLGAALIARTTRQVRLTEIGTAYYERCLDLVNGLEDVNHMVRTDQVEIGGILRVSAAGEFAEAHIAPALAEFAKRHRDLVIEIDLNSKNVDFVEEGFDFAIRYGRLQDSSLIARKLIDRTLVAAASPQYLEMHGVPQTPHQLASHSCLTANSNRWLFGPGEGETEVLVSGRWRSNSVRAILHACEAGLGIAYLPRKSYGSCLTDGTLTPILEPYWSASASSWIVYANRNFLPVKAQLAIKFLVERFRDWEE